jgi:HSP20 family protein
MNLLSPFSWGQDLTRRSEDDPFASLQKEINRIFDGFGRNGLSAAASLHSPRLDVAETPDAFEVRAELPGIEEKDIELTIASDVLTIRGEKRSDREEKRKDYHMVERSFGSFSRSLRLPFEASGDNAKARFDKGVLTVTIPKPADLKASVVKIPVKGV